MRACLIFLIWLWPICAFAQSKTVLPHELQLAVTLEETEQAPFEREMVLLTIRGVYRRHITREQLVQPDFEGFNWTQLGSDIWREERINGEKVKTMTRRMAIYPDRAGVLEIEAFTHNLTLTDDGDDWFEHKIYSEPVTLSVAAAPQTDGWWFPTQSLRISDEWSNAPDQLKPGEGVLRVIRIEALGVTPEMIPPMPELTSPSGMIFPHPVKRFVELSPAGPISYAFWRWTIRPGNDTSAIVEPLSFEYFNTQTRTTHMVTVSAQRVAFGDVTPTDKSTLPVKMLVPARLPALNMALLAIATFGAGLAIALWGRRVIGLRALQRFALLDPLKRGLRRAARQGHLAQTRRYAAALLARDGATLVRCQLLSELDKAVFNPRSSPIVLRDFARRFSKNAERALS